MNLRLTKILKAAVLEESKWALCGRDLKDESNTEVTGAMREMKKAAKC